MFRKSPIEHLKEEIQQQISSSADLEVKVFTFENQKMELIYISSLCDAEKHTGIISPPCFPGFIIFFL